MRFALADGERREAEPGLRGVCPVCGARMIPRCGEVYAAHWAHHRRRECDPWWENETEWHRAWKNQFPSDWQEVIQRADDGEKHIADVKTEGGWVLEFQHSYIRPEERRSRDDFYGRLVWIVDGLRRKTDGPQFVAAYNRGRPLFSGNPARMVSAEEGALFRDWVESATHVFFDFGGDVIWWLMPRSDRRQAFVIPILRHQFIQLHRSGGQDGVGFDQLAREIDDKVKLALTPRVVTRHRGRRRRL